MAKSNQISRKRIRFSASSASEILTRSKSQNQKGRYSRVEPSAFHSGNGFRGHQSPSISGKIHSKIIRTYPRVTIKDLRLRRVFSPSSLSYDWEIKSTGENQTKVQDEECSLDYRNLNIAKEGSKINDGGLGNAEAEEFLQTTPPENELLSSEPITVVNEVERINGPETMKNGTNLCSKSALHPCSRAKIFKNPGSFSYKRLLPYLMQAADGWYSKSEKPFDKNPPNIKLSCNKETPEVPMEDGSESMTAKCQFPETTRPVLQSVDRVFIKQATVNLCGNTSPLKKSIASSTNKKSACSRRKLFKTPGSVNYRRMLPYLRYVQEANPCEHESVNYPDHQKNTEEDTPSPMFVDNEGSQEMMTSNVGRESDICFNEDNELLPCERVTVSPDESDLDKELETQVKHVISGIEKNLETHHSVLSCEVPLSPPRVSSRSSSEVATSALNNTFVEKLSDEENMNGSEKTETRNSAEKLEANGSNLTTELSALAVVLETPPSISPSRGILKRSVRGCRGMCSCLNCSSFRLNAERAFEFSRNQLQDTEVMVLDLVGEIYHLRNILEKHGSADHKESYKTQAEEAAKRAFEATELAKSRLHQLNDDLQVHCRIPNEQRARVKFAHYVHEKTIDL